MVPVLLHGTLHATICQVQALPAALLASLRGSGSGSKSKSIRKFIKGIVEYRNHPPADIYVTVDLDKARLGHTMKCTSYNESHDLYWNNSFQFYCAHEATEVIFTIMLDKPNGASVIGRAYLSVHEILDGEEVERWLEILDDQCLRVGSRIEVKLQYIDVSMDEQCPRIKFSGVPYTMFSERQGCKISLYHDCHVQVGLSPEIPLADGMRYKPQTYEEDIFDAISKAQHLIYIAGWSINTKMTRDSEGQKDGGHIVLANLLKMKANEGVRVLVLLHGDNNSIYFLNKYGSIITESQKAMNSFSLSDVHYVLCPRTRDDSGSTVQDPTMFAHHQKIVVVDHEVPEKGSDKRMIVSFVGGMELCDGTYGNQCFAYLNPSTDQDYFRDLQRGPKNPGHETHARLEGPVAWDVLYSFEQRWRKQGTEGVLLPLRPWDVLYNFKRGERIQGSDVVYLPVRHVSDTIVPPSADVFPENEETWNVQLLRSIDSGSALGLAHSPGDAEKAKHAPGMDKIVDRSIQDAYINAIRRAKKFIYIENQYFLGSSYCWRPENIRLEDIGALHLIPKEIALKIVDKIEAGERFTVYIVIPMWTKGIPGSSFVQAILDWQRRTMEMMYTDVILALQAKGIDTNPKEYLTFFCLGSRKVNKTGEYESMGQPEPSSDYNCAKNARRSMISTHSKMMIVDDEYIIIGSADINQRSMDGARDTEIAIGAYQPVHLSTCEPARGHIYGFRMALWYKHLGMLDDVFLHPESLECVQKVNRIADINWDIYASNDLEQDLSGHLLSYPIGLTNEGVVAELPGTEFFPDTEAKVLGSKSHHLSPTLTT